MKTCVAFVFALISAASADLDWPPKFTSKYTLTTSGSSYENDQYHDTPGRRTRLDSHSDYPMKTWSEWPNNDVIYTKSLMSYYPGCFKSEAPYSDENIWDDAKLVGSNNINGRRCNQYQVFVDYDNEEQALAHATRHGIHLASLPKADDQGYTVEYNLWWYESGSEPCRMTSYTLGMETIMDYTYFKDSVDANVFKPEGACAREEVPVAV